MLDPSVARIRSFEVVPALPEPLKPLLDIAYNLWWSWHPDAVELFHRLDRTLWHETHHNPVKMLGICPQIVLDEAARDDGYIDSLKRVHDRLQRHLQRSPWLVRKKLDPGPGPRNPGRKDAQPDDCRLIAYFSAEFGLTECLQVYSGGLGCLAGDHLKSASELGLPLVGVGLLYRHGYFQQYLNPEGWQQEYYPDLDFANLPIRQVTDENGEQIRVSVDLPGRQLHIAVWRVQVGRVPLFLLDTNLSVNAPEDRGITGHLYGGDMEMRIRQEIVLGIGGMRALEACGVHPDVYHMNEGHSAFLGLEHIRRFIAKYDVTFDEARELASAAHVFTTHTPVPAGIDRFPPEMIEQYFRDFAPSLKLDLEGVQALGRENVFNRKEFFSMAVLALRTSKWVNGVSKLHAEVSRAMWKNIWPALPENEVPIQHVTNGVHARSWLSADMIALFDRYLGSRWRDDQPDPTIWQDIHEIPDEELWRAHARRRQQLIIWTRQQLKTQLEMRGSNSTQIRQAVDLLNPDALTIGFARRFATYKRGTLLLRDTTRLLKMLADTDKPIQFLIAGKAHPADHGGKDIIRQIVNFALTAPNGHKIVFLENYDINVGRHLIQGCDIWLNTPRRGMEASGTSGMKAAINGVLNCSIMDGWWDEGFQKELGWQIGRGEEYLNSDVADDIESRALYDLLEKQIIPMFYDRDEFGVPRRWVQWMKRCIGTLTPQFNTNRMVQEYSAKLYLPAIERVRKLKVDNMKPAVALAAQKQRLRSAWPNIAVESVDVPKNPSLSIRQTLPLNAIVSLNGLSPEDVTVQVYVGMLDNDGRLQNGVSFNLEHMEDLGNGRHRFANEIEASTSGRHGFAVRIVPGGEMFEGVFEPGMIKWEYAPAQAAASANKKEAKTVEQV